MLSLVARARWLVLLLPVYGLFSSVVQGCGGSIDPSTSVAPIEGNPSPAPVEPPPPGCEYGGYGYDYAYGCD